jgi:hypothetical protein
MRDLLDKYDKLLNEQAGSSHGGQIYQNARFTITKKCDGSQMTIGNKSVDGLVPEVDQITQPSIHWQNPTLYYIDEAHEDFKLCTPATWPPILTPVLPNGDPDLNPSTAVMLSCPNYASCIVGGNLHNSYNDILYHGSLPCQGAGGTNPNQITYNCIESDKPGVEGKCESVSGSGGQFETEDECMEACGRYVDRRRKRKED